MQENQLTVAPFDNCSEVGLSYAFYNDINFTSVNIKCYFFFGFTGTGFGLFSLPCYITLQSHFPANFPVLLSFTSLFNFVGVAVFPLIMQRLKAAYGLELGLLLFGAITWNTIVCGVCLRKVGRKRPAPTKKTTSNEKKDIPGMEMKEIGSETESIRKRQINNRKWFCSSIFYHKTFALLLGLELVAFYIFMSWALFLVSLGKTMGLSEGEAVFLSTAGGIGGFVGKLSAVFMFKYDKVNAYTCCLIPLVSNGLSMIGCTLVHNVYVLSILAFFSGISQGVNSSGVSGTIPTTICSHHFSEAIAISYFVDGVAMQLGGFFSGFLHDLLGSTIYIYRLDAGLCFMILPWVFVWACTDDSVQQCQPEINPKKV
ncbi:putative monocarboxylate transporter 4 [Apostichopus japonicus]|uniref:Putative monocarboxylate transporter 4 n=1 Tax=Stichopus japonicus TaxID=307972 RepID=A0A2G8LMZ7_STIJA|nr:putative monocarboxylate transporter 4 [Apostichopus japonicus]